MPNTPPPSSEKTPLQKNLEKARTGAIEGARWLKAEIARLVAAFKSQTKYFRWRTWIVVAYVAIAITSVVFALPPRNPIDAYVVPTSDFRGHIILAVENQSGAVWKDVRLVLDGQWEYRRESLEAGQKMQPTITEFVKISKRGDRPAAPVNLRPKVLRIETDDGSYQMKLYGD